ncbi:MAG: hypothetical protein HY231_16220, partial [Acidobacteria bacterium]|nr:hypothetical protein [Acidobacteriota bacterium]
NVYAGVNPTFDPTNNRISANQGYGYDAVGNVTQEPSTPTNKSYAYDGDNHQVSFSFNAQTTQYAYDGDGRRVRKLNPDNSSLVYVYNAMGQLIAEYATNTPTGALQTSYLTTDHLGSTRVVMTKDASGAVVVRARYDFLPFGEALTVNRSGNGYGGSDTTRQKFTGHERDQESGLDFAQARYCSSVTGRFMSPDPLSANGGKFEMPQSWNRYAYCVNNPLVYTDPSGLLWYVKSGTNQPVWFDGLPMENGQTVTTGWTVVNDYVYDAGDEGWVVLDPRSNNYGQFETKEDAQDAFSGLVDQRENFSLIDSALEMDMMLSGAAIGARIGGRLAAREATGEVAALAARRATQLSINRAAGKAAENLIAEQLVAEGNVLLGSQVTARTSAGIRFIDHLIETPAGEIMAIEVKHGGAFRNAEQLAKDNLMATEGATITGKNAPAHLAGRKLVIQTIERRVQ